MSSGRSRRAAVRTWSLRLVGVAAVVALLLAAAPGVAVLRFLSHDLALDRAVVSVALDWRDFGADRAEQRLRHELDRRGVQVDERSCALALEPEQVRRVACAWQVEVEIPLRAEPWRLAFTSTARIDRHGVLLR